MLLQWREDPPVGLDELEKVSGKMSIPVLALGGVKAGRIEKVKSTGAFGVAMISEILKAEYIQKKSKEIVQHCSK